MSGDARVLAEAIVRQLGADTPFLCYGTAQSALVAMGRQASLAVPENPSLDSLWQSIDDFIRAYQGSPIVGFIGFDPANQMNFEVEDYRQKVDLFVPNTLVACSGHDWHVLYGEEFTPSRPLQAGEGSRPALDPAQFDTKARQSSYRNAVARLLNSIQGGSLERATLARRIDVDRPLDLGATFLSDSSAHACARNFYFANDHIRFAGQSPELLAEGDSGCFTTHKLSGTCRRDTTVPEQQLREDFLADERIRQEHASSIGAINASLSGLGRVEVERFKVMDLPSLLHGWSEFTTRPEAADSIAACLRSVFPFGVKPMERGLELLRENEEFMRGPYYGLVGCIEAHGRFSFTQVLRSAFVDGRGSYLMAGAAVTGLSTPELEVRETCDKLGGVSVYGVDGGGLEPMLD